MKSSQLGDNFFSQGGIRLTQKFYWGINRGGPNPKGGRVPPCPPPCPCMFGHSIPKRYKVCFMHSVANFYIQLLNYEISCLSKVFFSWNSPKLATLQKKLRVHPTMPFPIKNEGRKDGTRWTQFGKKKNQSYRKIISWNQLFSKLFTKNFAFTNFCENKLWG